jgi:hypothetical protein
MTAERAHLSEAHRFLSIFSLRIAFVLAIWWMTGIQGCREGQPTEPPALPQFSGITQTDANGNIISIDPDDWQPIPAVGLTVMPAYPNPCQSTQGFTFNLKLTNSDSVAISVLDSPTHIYRSVFSVRLAAGSYQAQVNTTGDPPLVYRVALDVIRQDTVYSTHGDVEVTN